MKSNKIQKLLLGIGLAWVCGASAWAQVAVPSTYKTITIDGSFNDWAGVPLAYTAAPAITNTVIQFENVYIANDETNLYIHFTLYAPWDAFANSYDNIFIDADDDSGTGFPVAGIGSEMLIQDGAGYQEKGGGFNEGGINNLGWAIAGSTNNMDYELAISLGATYATDDTSVFTNNTIAILLEGDELISYTSAEFVPPSGGFVYTFAPVPPPLTNNLTLIGLTNTSWALNDSGTDLGTNWLAQNYDDTATNWISGNGLFGHTAYPGAYPPINTALSNGPTTFYFRTDFLWTNNTADVAFVVTNYLSDGAVYYFNGVELTSIRMPLGQVSYETLATGTNSPVGQSDVFAVDGGDFVSGTNSLEVEVHPVAGNTNEIVFGLSLTASIQYPVLI